MQEGNKKSNPAENKTSDEQGTKRSSKKDSYQDAANTVKIDLMTSKY